jgi:pyruvate/2-oxoglutarate dehydrogenase complex dihydrolipoamide acyltransferase (E2) component
MSGELIEVKIEDPGDTVEVEVIELMVAVGDTVAEGAPLMEVATDKANADIGAPAGGVVEAINVAVGDIVDVGAVLAVLRT